MKLRLLALPLCLACVSASLRADDADEPLKILFLGNSFTYANDMPHILQGLAASRGRRLDVAMHAPGGCTLEKHWQDGKAAELIESKKWDVVVLQESSTGPIENLKGMKEYAGKLHEHVKKQGARTVLFETWARQDKMATTRRIALAYEETAKELGAAVAPVGLAWQKARAGNKPFTLHAADKNHPNELGSYLAACVFFAALVDPKTDGLPGRLVFDGKMLTSIPTADAARLQRIARETVREGKAGDRG
ncbi:MAG: hypothetical protein IT426_06570 [Pirellulales bacterium]|nr:hypothetical protein [Pirellulales bacterium]